MRYSSVLLGIQWKEAEDAIHWACPYICLMIAAVTRTLAKAKLEKNQSGRILTEQWSVATSNKTISFWGRAGLYCIQICASDMPSFLLILLLLKGTFGNSYESAPSITSAVLCYHFWVAKTLVYWGYAWLYITMWYKLVSLFGYVTI